MKLTLRSLFIALLLTLLGTPQALAIPPKVITLQGVLRDGAGQLQSMAVNVQVDLYTAQIGGTLINTYVPTMVQAQNGVFTLNITDNNILSRLTTTEVWAEIFISGMGTFPRQQLTSTPFALQAAQLVCSNCIGPNEAQFPIASSFTAFTLGVGINRGAPALPYSQGGQCLVIATLYLATGPATPTNRPTWRIYQSVDGVVTGDDTNDTPAYQFGNGPGPITMTRSYHFSTQSGHTDLFGCQVDVQAGSSWLTFNPICTITYMCA